MKKAINFQLDENILFILERLSQELNTTKANIVEKSIQYFSQQKHNELSKFVGILNDKEAKVMLDNIKRDKLNKDFSLEL